SVAARETHVVWHPARKQALRESERANARPRTSRRGQAHRRVGNDHPATADHPAGYFLVETGCYGGLPPGSGREARPVATRRHCIGPGLGRVCGSTTSTYKERSSATGSIRPIVCSGHSVMAVDRRTLSERGNANTLSPCLCNIRPGGGCSGGPLAPVGG